MREDVANPTSYQEIVPPVDCAACPRRPHVMYSPICGEAIDALRGLRLRQRLVPAKTLIFREDEPVEEFYTLFDGWGFRYKLLADGRRQILSFLLPGDPLTLGVLTVKALSYSVQTLTVARLCVFDREETAAFIQSESELRQRYQRLSVHEIAGTYERLADLGRRSAKERMARLILDIHARLNANGVMQGNTFDFPLRQEHVADALGLTTIHVSRTLRALREEGLVAYHANAMQILDYQNLVAISGFRDNYLALDGTA